MGVWIETCLSKTLSWSNFSHTLYGCVDWNKDLRSLFPPSSCHTLYGCVDWNLEKFDDISAEWRHTLYGCVDWNDK